MCDFMAVGNACDLSCCLATHFFCLPVGNADDFPAAGNAYDLSWRLATLLTFMVVGNAYGLHGGWQRI